MIKCLSIHSQHIGQCCGRSMNDCTWERYLYCNSFCFKNHRYRSEDIGSSFLWTWTLNNKWYGEFYTLSLAISKALIPEGCMRPLRAVPPIRRFLFIYRTGWNIYQIVLGTWRLYASIESSVTYEKASIDITGWNIYQIALGIGRLYASTVSSVTYEKAAFYLSYWVECLPDRCW